MASRPASWLALVGAAAVGAAALVVGAAPASAASATIAEIGWWTRDPAATAPPEGGVAVANAPDGPLTVSAVRIQVPAGGAGTVTLSLSEADAVAPVGAGVQACVTRSPWVAASGAAYDDAPEPACDSGAVELTRADDGSWRGDISALVGAGAPSVSIMVVPADGAPAAFELTFERPVLSSTGSPEPSPATTAVGTSPSPSAAPPPSAPAATPSLSLTDPPAPAAPSAGGTAAAAPFAPGDAFAALPTRPQLPAAGGNGGGKDWAQLGRLLSLSLVFGVVLAGSRRGLVVLEPRAKVSAAVASLRSRRGPMA